MTAVASDAVGASQARRLGIRWPWVAFAALFVVAAAVVLRVGRGTSFYYDEWSFILTRRPWTADSLLLPHNEHLSLVPLLVYKVLFELFGLGSYLPYRVCVLALHGLVALLLFAYARPRVGPIAALLAAAVVLFLGQGYFDFVWPFQIGFLASLAAGIGALLALDRRDRRGDVTAGVLLAVALASSSVGIPVLVAVAVDVLGGRRRRAAWPVVAIPLALYALWYVTYRIGEPGADPTLANLLDTPAYVAEAAAGALGAATGLDTDWGRILVVVAVLGVVAAALRLPHRWQGVDAVPWRVVALVAAPLAFWIVTALIRANLNEPDASRYLYPGVVFLLLLAVELARGRTAPPALLALLAVLVGASVLSNLGALRDGAGYLRDHATVLRGQLAAVEAMGSKVDPAFRPDPNAEPVISAGPYLAAVDEYGSPAYAPGELPSAYSAARTAADQALVSGLALAAGPAAPRTGGTAPAVVAAQAATVTPSGACQLVDPQGAGANAVVSVPPGGLTVDAEPGAVGVALRRYADGFTPIVTPTDGAPFSVRIPADGGPGPWWAQVISDGPVRICGAAA